MRKEVRQGLYQALGVAAYCSIIGYIMQNGDKIFGEMDNFLGPITFLIMLSVSVLVCGIIVFYKPYKLFFDGKKKEAGDVVLSTATVLIMILAILFIILLFI